MPKNFSPRPIVSFEILEADIRRIGQGCIELFAEGRNEKRAFRGHAWRSQGTLMEGCKTCLIGNEYFCQFVVKFGKQIVAIAFVEVYVSIDTIPFGSN